MSGTADPKSARDHARAMEGTRVEAMPTVPASRARDLPSGVSPERVVWDETIAPGGYASKRLDRGARLQLTDLQGDACASVLIFNAEETQERLCVADTVKVQWNAYLGAGKLLLSDMGRVLCSIIEDDAETHDCFCGASNDAGNARKYGEGPHLAAPSGRDRFLKAVAKHGLTKKDVHPCINFFKGVRIGGDGETLLNVGPYALGRRLVLRAEMNIIIVIADCAHVLDPREAYTVTPLRVTAWRDFVTPENDRIRLSAPESVRAFLNTEEYFLR
jgi:urea carboxylase-associated protein 2